MMKISDAIIKLQSVLSAHGDIFLTTIDEIDDMFSFDFNSKLDVIEIMREDENNRLQKVVVLTGSDVVFRPETPKQELQKLTNQYQ